MRTDPLVISLLFLTACELQMPEPTPRDCETRTLYYADDDGDGLGDPDHVVLACEQPDNAVDNADDCDDEDASEGEVCDTGDTA